jgi:hypothetical protein
MAWEYMIKQFATGDRWTAEGALKETMRLEDYANKMGEKDWEMVSFQPVPIDPVGHSFVVVFKKHTP